MPFLFKNFVLFLFFVFTIERGFCSIDRVKVMRDLTFFEQSPNIFFNLIPSKRVVSSLKYSASEYQNESIDYDGKYLDNKFRDKGELCKKLSGNPNCIKTLKASAGDLQTNVTAFLQANGQTLLNIKEINKLYPVKAETTISPWSDYYWAYYNGALGFRFDDRDFPYYSSDFMQKYNYVMIENSADTFLSKLFSTNANSVVENLSPAEKYDLLVNDKNWTLTSKMWNTSKQYLVNNEIETWMGLCHGWAPASFKMGRPNKSIIVKAADGKTKIKFYPSDIKALATLLWAEANFDNQFIGERCNVKNPTLDANGRIINRACFDVNPAVWHLIALHKMGKERENFIIDATYDRQVWNQPVAAYEYSYFNPITKTPGSFEQSVIEKNSFINDKFKKYRSKNYSYVVGVVMELVYVVENSPNTNDIDGVDHDVKHSVSYYYDLELDQDFNIVGGEWYQNAHPDFIWTPAKSAVALSDQSLESSATGNWDIINSLPVHWAEMGKKSSLYSLPLSKIVNTLIGFTN